MSVWEELNFNVEGKKGFRRTENIKFHIVSSDMMQVRNDQVCEDLCLSNWLCNACAYSRIDGHCNIRNEDFFNLKRLQNYSGWTNFNIKVSTERSFARWLNKFGDLKKNFNKEFQVHSIKLAFFCASHVYVMCHACISCNVRASRAIYIYLT